MKRQSVVAKSEGSGDIAKVPTLAPLLDKGRHHSLPQFPSHYYGEITAATS